MADQEVLDSLMDDPHLSGPENGQEGGQKTFKVKANGVERELSEEEVVQWASKALGADEKFREASEARREAEEMRKKAERAMRVEELQKKVNDENDVDAFVELARDYWGWPEENIQTALQNAGYMDDSGQQKQGQTPQRPQGGQQGMSKEDRDAWEAWKQFHSQAQQKGIDPFAALESASGFTYRQSREIGRNETFEVLKKDPVFGKIARKNPDSPVLEGIWKEVERIVDSGEGSFSSPDSKRAAIKKAVDKVRPFIDAGREVYSSGSTAPSAFGAIPSTGTAVDPHTPPKRPEEFDASKHRDNLGSYLQQMMAYDAFHGDAEQ